VRLNKTVEPDVVFMPSENDIHQDHRVIAEEGLRAFKKTTILCYELPWNNLNFTNTCFIRFGEAELDQKVKAMGCYKSQQGKGYASEEFIRALALTRGTQIGVRYAEVFEVLRLVI
jgi:LmbE family N-acetylglucosaminyl deacetylase